jgi:2-(1,2-epoxy-1,2-dihydrophenyl)acetyl-CoA isomerase
MEFKHILFEIEDEIATITMNRPEARNALSPEMRVEFDAVLSILKEAAGDTVKAVILTGAGGAFCAGGDVKAMVDRSNHTAEAARVRMRTSHNRVYDIMNLELPVIAAVNGPAAGAGCNLALACDFILATPRSIFMQAFGRIGLVPDWGGFFTLPRIVGLQRAKDLVMTARKLGAEEAKEMGIVYEIHPEDQLMERAREFAGRFRKASTTAIALSKNILNQSFNLDHRAVLEMEAFAQAVCNGSAYHQAAVQRFVDKEPPLFNWEAMAREAAE